MKKIINKKTEIVSDMLQGYAAAYEHRVVLEGNNILCRKKEKDIDKVGLLIGNGSGHEPAMVDLVGEGLFDANVCGRIFTAPSPLEMLEGIRVLARNGRKKVLIMVSSHAGDILNAKMAIMLGKAEGFDVEMVVLWDDISSAPKGKEQERRGTAGLFFAFKIIGAAAEAGLSIDMLIALAEKVRDRTRTLGVAISSGLHPETGLASFELLEDEVEIGMGVHGEKGSGCIKLGTADELVTTMLSQILEDKPFQAGDKVMVLLNNSGATTRMELLIVYKSIARILKERGIEVVRNWVGTYVTTQEMGGFSISLCKADEEIIKYYDMPADSPLFQNGKDLQ